MADDEPLTKEERALWEYIQEGDFEGGPWSTPDAAKALKMSEDDVYAALAEVNKKVGDDLYIYYKNGAIRLATEWEIPKGKAPKGKAVKGKPPKGKTPKDKAKKGKES
jgi:hypothetical protein